MWQQLSSRKLILPAQLLQQLNCTILQSQKTLCLPAVSQQSALSVAAQAGGMQMQTRGQVLQAVPTQQCSETNSPRTTLSLETLLPPETSYHHPRLPSALALSTARAWTAVAM